MGANDYSLQVTPGGNPWLEDATDMEAWRNGRRAQALTRDSLDGVLRAWVQGLIDAVDAAYKGADKGIQDELAAAVKRLEAEIDAYSEQFGLVPMEAGTGYSLAVLDQHRRISELALDESGRFPQWVLDRWARRMGVTDQVLNLLGLSPMEAGSGYSLAVMDTSRRLSELALDESGRFPQWVLDRWAERLPKPPPPVPGGRRDALVSAFKARRGGRIGTGGKPVICLRFDHGLTPFQEKILPLLRERGLPSMNTMNSRTWDAPSNSGMSQAQARAAWLNDGVEFTNHGATHDDAATRASVEDNIVAGLAELQGQFPESVVEGFAPSGVTGTRYMGFEEGGSAAQWADTLAGQLVRDRHAACFGYSTGAYRPQTDLEIGAAHITMDAQNAAWLKAAIRGAVEARAAMTLMLHPVRLDANGYITTADLTAVLDDLVARRDAGEILVTTATGSLLLDPTTSYRHDLIPGGWDVSLAAGATATRTIGLSRLASLRGGMRDIEATGSGSYQVAVSDGGPLNVTRARNGSSHTPFSIPVSAQSVTVTITATTATTLTVTAPVI